MALLAVADLRAFLETDLPDAVLQLYLDDAEAEITRAIGAVGARTVDYRTTDAGGTQLFLSPPAASVGSVAEVNTSGSTTLAVDTDFVIQYGGRVLLRVNRPWLPYLSCSPTTLVRVTYTPVDDTARRKRVQVDLVRLALTYQGNVDSESEGEHSASGSGLTYEGRRSEVLSRLNPAAGVVV